MLPRAGAVIRKMTAKCCVCAAALPAGESPVKSNSLLSFVARSKHQSRSQLAACGSVFLCAACRQNASSSSRISRSARESASLLSSPTFLNDKTHTVRWNTGLFGRMPRCCSSLLCCFLCFEYSCCLRPVTPARHPPKKSVFHCTPYRSIRCSNRCLSALSCCSVIRTYLTPAKIRPSPSLGAPSSFHAASMSVVNARHQIPLGSTHCQSLSCLLLLSSFFFSCRSAVSTLNCCRSLLFVVCFFITVAVL